MQITTIMTLIALFGTGLAGKPRNWQTNWKSCRHYSTHAFGKGHHKISVARYEGDIGDTCPAMDFAGNCAGTTRVKDGECKNFQIFDGKPTHAVNFALPNKDWAKQMEYCELTIYDQKDCNGKAVGYFTERNAVKGDWDGREKTHCDHLIGDEKSAMMVCATLPDELYEKGGTPWKDNITWFLGHEQKIVNKHFHKDKVYAECARRDCIKSKGSKCKILDWVQEPHGCISGYPVEGQEEWRTQEWY